MQTPIMNRTQMILLKKEYVAMMHFFHQMSFYEAYKMCAAIPLQELKQTVLQMQQHLIESGHRVEDVLMECDEPVL